MCIYMHGKTTRSSTSYPNSTKTPKSFWGYIILFALQLFMEKISVTIKASCMGIQQAWPSKQFLFLPLNHIMHGKTQSKPSRASTLCYFTKGQKVSISQKQFFTRQHSHIHKVELQSIPLITMTITLNIKIKLNFSQLFMLENSVHTKNKQRYRVRSCIVKWTPFTPMNFEKNKDSVFQA